MAITVVDQAPCLDGAMGVGRFITLETEASLKVGFPVEPEKSTDVMSELEKGVARMTIGVGISSSYLIGKALTLWEAGEVTNAADRRRYTNALLPERVESLQGWTVASLGEC